MRENGEQSGGDAAWYSFMVIFARVYIPRGQSQDMLEETSIACETHNEERNPQYHCMMFHLAEVKA